MNKEIERCINVIADNIKERAKDISNDLKNVLSIEIKAKIENGTILNFEVIISFSWVWLLFITVSFLFSSFEISLGVDIYVIFKKIKFF